LTELTPHARYSGQLKLPTVYNSQIVAAGNKQQDQPPVSMVSHILKIRDLS
jgi:hypothetical protein